MPLWQGARSIYRHYQARHYAYTRQVEIRVRRQSLLHNLSVFNGLCAPVRVAPVLKSNAYGHGLVPVARVLDEAQCPFIVVDGYHEALILRNEGIRTPVVVMGYTWTKNILRSRLKRVAFMVGDMAQLKALADDPKQICRLHLKVNTGMNRHGVRPSEYKKALAIIEQARHLVLEGVCSHLADAYSRYATVTRQQIRTWNTLTRDLREDNLHLHLSNTGGTYWTHDIVANVARVGLGLYGIDPSPHRDLSLQPVLSVHSHVGTVFHVPQGERVGYSLTWVATSDSTLAMVPTGYNSCVDARLANKGVFMIDDVVCPIAGRVCMNATMIDVTGVPNIRPGREITVISAMTDAPNSVTSVARLCGVNAYIILTGLSSALRRIVI